MLRRWWNYIKTWFGVKSKAAMNPEIEIEAAITEARANDQALRNEAAKVIAHRTKLAGDVEDAAAEAAKAKELAQQALLKADAATSAGDAAEAAKWTRAAQSIALRLQSANNNEENLHNQLITAEEQARQAQTAVNQNAMRLEQISAKKMEMVGQLQAAKMQESVNKAMASISAKVGGDAPTLEEIEDKIEQRAAEASAKAELTSQTPDGAMAELEQAVDLSEADAALDELRAEMGLAAASSTPPAPSAPPPVELPPADTPQPSNQTASPSQTTPANGAQPGSGGSA